MRGLVALLLVAATAAAPASAATRLNKREFARRGNAICASYYRGLSATPEPKTRAELGSYLRKQLRLADTQTLKLSKLQPPAPYARAFAKMLAVARLESRQVPKLIRAIEANDPQQIQALAAYLFVLDKKDNAYANSIGLTV